MPWGCLIPASIYLDIFQHNELSLKFNRLEFTSWNRVIQGICRFEFTQVHKMYKSANLPIRNWAQFLWNTMQNLTSKCRLFWGHPVCNCSQGFQILSHLGMHDWCSFNRVHDIKKHGLPRGKQNRVYFLVQNELKNLVCIEPKRSTYVQADTYRTGQKQASV